MNSERCPFCEGDGEKCPLLEQTKIALDAITKSPTGTDAGAATTLNHIRTSSAIVPLPRTNPRCLRAEAIKKLLDPTEKSVA